MWVFNVYIVPFISALHNFQVKTSHVNAYGDTAMLGITAVLIIYDPSILRLPFIKTTIQWHTMYILQWNLYIKTTLRDHRDQYNVVLIDGLTDGLYMQVK